MDEFESWVFTGTQQGITRAQHLAFRRLFVIRQPMVFRHGDCIGADATAHNVVITCSAVTPWIHPCDIEGKRAWCEPGSVLPVLPPLERNHRMVDAAAPGMVKRVVATPGQDHEILRSGTWATVRYAAGKNIWVTVIMPSGRVEDHWERNHK